MRLFPAQWINGLQTVADPDHQIRWGPGLPDSEIKGGGGGWVGRFWSKNKGGGASPSPGSGTNRKCSIHKVKAAKLDACVKSKQTNRKKQVALIYKNSCEVYLNLIKLKIRDL